MIQKAIFKYASDHIPFYLSMEGATLGPRPFRSFNTWFDHLGLCSMVKKEGESYGGSNVNLLGRLKVVKGMVKRW